jgi:TM2 domain-containing membrane protein YozV
MSRIIAIVILFICSLMPIIYAQHGDLKKGKVIDKRSTYIPLIHGKENRLSEHKKWVAVTLNITLGMFGVHRLYLGTSPKVPVIYTFTLGGGGIIILGDLVAIISAKDLEKYTYDPKVIMWGGED